ncbi:MAG: twin-arginine translocase TatA/TatE family subunit [Alphaproteobacteria bacterium]|nr:twin-arginine translocase TatA/TatE family subunit [Alphaproteobacteria bacterium]
MFGRLGWTEILIIVVLVIILFGHNKIPGMMKNLADGLKVFKKELKGSDKANAKQKPKVANKNKTVSKKK